MTEDPKANLPNKHVVVTGATGNVGTAVVRALGTDPSVGSVLGVARRDTDWTAPKAQFAAVDIAVDDLDSTLHGADALVHLAWLFQPTHKAEATWSNNVLGTIRTLTAAAAAGVSTIVVASSVGAYSPGPRDDRRVDESWPTHGWPGAAYPREKAYLERWLDAFELGHPDIRVVRMRPGFIFQRGSASAQRRIFAGPFVPGSLLRTIPVVPDMPGLRMQIVHADDVAEAYRLAVVRPVRGAFNIAAEDSVDARTLADVLSARVVAVRPGLVRSAVAAAWHAHIAPAEPGLLDTVLRLPLMDCARARAELGWSPAHAPADILDEFVEGLRAGAGLPTPPLAPDSPRGRIREIATGVGVRP
ncbi:NAD-dependent epimerase/dehydratase family protein [Rhodococcus sp. SJ-3]|uniref:NAD-dependent epimerase/dehydratase family protein n=1 Tax=Rhodococcus sp. SJ-3 TaxID=3454628 RepID=UPI003F796CE2